MRKISFSLGNKHIYVLKFYSFNYYIAASSIEEIKEMLEKKGYPNIEDLKITRLNFYTVKNFPEF